MLSRESFVAAVALHEFRHQKAGLELDPVHGHDAPQELVWSSSFSTGSLDEPSRAWLSHVANQKGPLQGYGRTCRNRVSFGC